MVIKVAKEEESNDGIFIVVHRWGERQYQVALGRFRGILMALLVALLVLCYGTVMIVAVLVLTLEKFGFRFRLLLRITKRVIRIRTNEEDRLSLSAQVLKY